MIPFAHIPFVMWGLYMTYDKNQWPRQAECACGLPVTAEAYVKDTAQLLRWMLGLLPGCRFGD